VCVCACVCWISLDLKRVIESEVLKTRNGLFSKECKKASGSCRTGAATEQKIENVWTIIRAGDDWNR
jgi:hypothetical protein